MKTNTLVALFFAAVALVNVSFASSSTTQLVNALIARSGLNAIITGTNSVYTPYGIGAGSCDVNSAFPADSTVGSSLKVCVISTLNFFPFNNQSAGTGVEAQLIASFAALLQTQYSRRITVDTVIVPSTAAGFQATLFNALLAGTCDTIISDASQTTSRDLIAEASCPYATTFSGIARSTLDSNETLTTIDQLAAFSGLKVAYGVSTVYDTLLHSAQFNKNITFFPVTSTLEGTALLKSNTVHVQLGDAATLKRYLETGCVGCNVYSYGSATALVAYQRNATTVLPANPTTSSSTSAAFVVAPVMAVLVAVVALFAL